MYVCMFIWGKVFANNCRILVSLTCANLISMYSLFFVYVLQTFTIKVKYLPIYNENNGC